MLDEFVYVAFEDYQALLLKELNNNYSQIHENLIFSSLQKMDCCFAQDIWLNPVITHFSSINDAVKILRDQQLYWYTYPLKFIRRSRLIEAKLKNPFSKPIPFSSNNEYPETGVFCLLDYNTLLYSSKRLKKIPFGIVNFQEDKINPPNRAYLKLWEAFTLLNHYPKTGELAYDLGASPGGWSYVIASLGADVTAVDKAPLASPLNKNKHIHYLQQSAFALQPEKLTNIDWLCADIACYPDRLYNLIQSWINSGKARQIICTIKLQGETDLAVIQKFQSIKNSAVFHLFYNKHEATFFHPFHF